MRITFFILLFALFSFAQQERLFTYGSWNIRWEGKDDAKKGDAWEKRFTPIANVIRFHDFDIIGIQEGSKGKLEKIAPLLKEYAIIRNEINEENPILYKKTLFKLLDKGRFYLSEKPNTRGKGWDAQRVRFCTWAKMQTGENIFYIFNIHFDYRGNQAKKESVELIKRMVPAIAQGFPFFLAGDFNLAESSSGYKNLAQPPFQDAKHIADFTYEPKKSYNYFDPQRYSLWDLDHVFINKGMHILRYGVLNETYYDGEKYRYPSDHQPLLIKFYFSSEQK